MLGDGQFVLNVALRSAWWLGKDETKQKPAKFMVKEIEELHPRIRNSNMDDADPNSHFKFLLQRGT